MSSNADRIDQLTQTARDTPSETPTVIPELLTIDSERDRGLAAMSIKSLATNQPTAAAPAAGEIADTLTGTEKIRIRRKLVSALEAIVTVQPDVGPDVANGLNDATRVRDEQYWHEEPIDEIRTIETALSAWVVLAENDYDVPTRVVDNSAAVLNVADTTTVRTITALLAHVVGTDHERAHVAETVLQRLAQNDHEGVADAARTALENA